MQTQEEEDFLTEDASEILPDKPYHWCDWSIVLDTFVLYLWNGATVLILHTCCIRHFKFILNGKLSTMNVDGSYRSNSNESRREILEKLQTILRNQVKSGPPSQPILSVPGFIDLDVGPWRLFSTSAGQIRVDHSFNDGVIELKEGLPGFIYKTNSGGEKSFIAKKSLGSEFAAGWARKKVKRFKAKSKSEDLPQKEEEFLREDATEILHGKPYHWRDWSLFLDKSHLYMWNEAAVLKFYRYSSGTFYFILNGMASILDPDWKDLSIDPDDNRRETLGKLQVVLRNQVKTGPPSQPILTAPGGTRLVVWRWSLFCNKEGEISIHNSLTPEQSITLKENFNGFIFVSNCGTTRLFTAETSLGPEFAAGWAKKEEKCFNAKSKLGSLKKKEEEFLRKDATEILPGKPYYWRDWSLFLDKSDLYLWNGAAVLAFDRYSDGWFDFILNGKASILRPDWKDPSNDSDDNRRQTLGKLQAILRNHVETGSPSQPILTAPGGTRLVVCRWSLFCNKEGEISIHNSRTSKQSITLKENFNGFIFVSNCGTKRLFTAETSLGPAFAAGWAKKEEKCFNAKSKLGSLKQKQYAYQTATQSVSANPAHGMSKQVSAGQPGIYHSYGGTPSSSQHHQQPTMIGLAPSPQRSPIVNPSQQLNRDVAIPSVSANPAHDISKQVSAGQPGIYHSYGGTPSGSQHHQQPTMIGLAPSPQRSPIVNPSQQLNRDVAIPSVSANPAHDISKQVSAGQPGIYHSYGGTPSGSQHHQQPTMIGLAPSPQRSPIVNPSQQLNRDVAIPEEDLLSEGAKEILPGKRYQWRNWSIVLHDIYLYLWSNAAVLDLCKESGGWFRFILDGEIAVMHSRGFTVKVPDGCKRETLEKLHAIHRNQVKSGTPIQPILTLPGATRFVVGNWSLFCNTEDEIRIRHCIYCKHAIILKEDVPGFIFESSIGKTSSFTDKVSINSVCAAGWVEKKEKNFNHKSKSETLIQMEEDLILEDAKEIVPGKPYHWRDWSIVLDKDYFFLWSNAAILQLSKGDVGWFRFILDGKISLMYPDGTPGIELDECRREVQQKLQAVHQSQKETGPPSQPILSASGSTPLIVGPWSLFSKREGEIRIHNSSLSQEAIVLKEDLSGFIFETDVGGTQSFIAKKSLVPEFAAGWAKKKEKSSKPKLKLKDLKPKENVTKPKVGKCSYCKTTLNEDILLFHVKDCVHRPTNCPNCSVTMPLKDIDNHCCDL